METRKHSSGKNATLTNKIDFYFRDFSCLLNPLLRLVDSLLTTNYIDYQYLWGNYKTLGLGKRI